jgi:transposase
MAIRVRELTEEELGEIERLAQSRTEPARRVERARMVLYSHEGLRVPAIAAQLRVYKQTVRIWLERFNQEGLAGLEDRPRSGRPATYSVEVKSEVVAASLTKPDDLGLPFGSWTLDRLEAYMSEQKEVPIKRSRIQEILVEEGLRWRSQETWFGERVDPDFAKKRGVIEQLYTAPPEGSVVVCVDEMGPESAKTFRGWELVARPVNAEDPAPRACQEIDYGRRGKGYIYGAFQPATGEVLTKPYERRDSASFVDFLVAVEAWVPAEIERVYVILDNLSTHRTIDVLLFAVAHERWEFIYQPKYAAYLNLIEPWWKILRSLALKGRRFETWEEIWEAIEKATAYWNTHRHPFVWGHRRRHRTRRQSGIATMPNAA